MNKQKSILICPLNWGIGHASRCVPIIRCLQQMNHRVVVAADLKPLALLQSVFPEIEFIRFPGYEPNYSKSNMMVLKMMKEAPAIIRSFKNDIIKLDEIIQQKKIDGVISDNRFGASTKKIPSVFITHQLFIQTPELLKFTKPIINYLNFNYIKKFNEVWIPDFEKEPNLSGNLSHGNLTGLNVKYIGPLSRFSENDNEQTEKTKKIYDLLVMLSGPEPQRSLLETLILNQLKNTKIKTIIIRGLPGEQNVPVCYENLTMINHVNQNELLTLISQSEQIVARAGYSTIMDFIALKRKAVLIPTPGQTEQLYLAEYLGKYDNFTFIQQKDFKVSSIRKSSFNSTFLQQKNKDLLKSTMNTWLSSW